MHELSLVQGLLRQLQTLADEHTARRISRVKVEVGPLSGVVVDSFRFGFEALAPEMELTREAELDIVIPPMRFKCCACGGVTASEKKMPDHCPCCGHSVLVPDGGDSLMLLQVEME